jgi:hypothetical protein
MKKFIIAGIILFLNCTAFSQNAKYTRTELSLYKIENKGFECIIDSVVSFSEQCEGKGLKFLNFMLDIRETELNYYQIYVTLVDCQGMNFLLTTENRNKPIGYFVYKNKVFIISGRRNLGELLKRTNLKKIFTTNDSKNLLGIDYTNWTYSYYGPDNRFKSISFNPICIPEKDRIFPICDSMNIKK